MKKSLLLCALIMITTTRSNAAEQNRTKTESDISSNLHIDWQKTYTLLDEIESKSFINDYHNEIGETLLYSAVFNNEIDVAKKLLEVYRANPNVTHIEGFIFPGYPLSVACFNKNISMIRLLIKHGANPFLKDHKDCDAFYYAQGNIDHSSKQTAEIIKILNTYRK
jgi:ankyrin repeat protein